MDICNLRLDSFFSYADCADNEGVFSAIIMERQLQEDAARTRETSSKHHCGFLLLDRRSSTYS